MNSVSITTLTKTILATAANGRDWRNVKSFNQTPHIVYNSPGNLF